jgi:glycosyltransferase involved in cell wall biosynthesis
MEQRILDVVIPTYNEEKCIETCLNSIFDACEYVETTMSSCRVRVTVTDGGSVDDTLSVIENVSRRRDRNVRIVRQPKNGVRGRGAVLQRAALCLLQEEERKKRKDDDDLFIFLHADVQVERTYLLNVHEFFDESGFQVGFCRMDFGKKDWSFKFLCWVATFDSPVTSFGDQGILVRRGVYKRVGGFKPLPLCEDVEFFSQCRPIFRPHLVPLTLYVSPRKFDERGVVTYMIQCCVVCTAYHMGFDSKTLIRLYADPFYVKWVIGIPIVLCVLSFLWMFYSLEIQFYKLLGIIY